MNDSIEAKLLQELAIYDDQVDVHQLPDIYHYWSNRFLRPILEEYGFANPDELFAKYLHQSALACGANLPIFVSIGAGNCDLEIRMAKSLKEKGIDNFCIECLELNPKMLQRGLDLARKEGVSANLSFIVADFNRWKANREYTAVMANQSLHHVVNLEGLFAEIKRSLHPKGLFITSDMIGRNGHQRWPEALEAVHRFWRELPQSHRYNHQLKRYEELYENWDCSKEGFEGIRAQDILPLLVETFSFELFIGFANVVDVFIDRGFGHNFDDQNPRDKEFIDRLHHFDEENLRSGHLKPTHVMAVMKKTPVENPQYSRGLSPAFCVREPEE